jgi:hypothetical protein
MMGWHISVSRQAEDRTTPASPGVEGGPRLAVWQTGIEGLQWIKELVAGGNAIDRGGNGYPSGCIPAFRVHLLDGFAQGLARGKPSVGLYGKRDSGRDAGCRARASDAHGLFHVIDCQCADLVGFGFREQLRLKE